MAILRRVTHAAEGRADALLVVNLVVVVLQVVGVIWWMEAFERGRAPTHPVRQQGLAPLAALGLLVVPIGASCV